MQGDKVFLDTNIMIYAYDISAGEKHEIAKNHVIDFWNSRLGLISTRVLQEFFVTVTKKISKPLEVKLAKEIVNDFLEWDIVVNDSKSILEAIEIHCRYNYSFWDSLIIQAAIKGVAELLLSEDLSDGQKIGSIMIKNPFVGDI